jgi:putative intracellular protease/amidase
VLVAIPLFERFTALDAVGPYEVLQRVPSIDVVFVGHQRGEVRSDNGMLGMTVDRAFPELRQPDVVVFPGGIGTRVLINDAEVLDWVRWAHEHSRFTTSVCTGGLVLAAAGLLTGLTATTHWRVQELFNSLGAQYVPKRVVEHLPQRIITAAGVSSGIDMALRFFRRSALPIVPKSPGSAISQISGRSCSLSRLPTQVTLLPRTGRGRTRP